MPSKITPATMDVLRFIADSPEQKARVAALENRFGKDDAYHRIQVLHEVGCIEASDHISDPPGPIMRLLHPVEYRLMPKGADALAEQQRAEDEVRKQNAEQIEREMKQEIHEAEKTRKEHHHDYFVAAFEVLLGILIGIFLEHYGQIIALVQKLFH